MSRRVMAMVVLGALVLSVIVVAGLLAAGARQKPIGGDFIRCPATCNTIIKYYGEKRPTLKTHEGDQQCWQTCDARFNQGHNAGNMQAMKAFWSQHRPTSMRTNQCAQACWRKFHNGSSLVRVAGRESDPRGVACAPGATRTTANRSASPKPA